MNPAICLYHSTKIEGPDEVSRYDDIVEYAGLKTEQDIPCIRKLKNLLREEGHDEQYIEERALEVCDLPKEYLLRTEFDELLDRERGVYFVKKEENIIGARGAAYETVEVPAEFIPCKCNEYDYDKSNELWELLLAEHFPYSQYPDNVKKIMEKEGPMGVQDYKFELAEEILSSGRPLSNEKFYDRSEVICDCDVPAEIIEPLDEQAIGSCRINRDD